MDVFFDIETGPLAADIVQHRAELRATNFIGEEKEKRIRDSIEFAPLNAETGRTVAIGYSYPAGDDIVGVIEGSMTEEDVLCDFWDRVITHRSHGDNFVGFNIFGFDLKFIVRRCWYLNLGRSVIGSMYRFMPDKYGKWNDMFIDLAAVYGMKSQDRISLNLLCECLGLEGKNGCGKEFAGLWETDRQQASEYLINDLRMTREVAERMGVV